MKFKSVTSLKLFLLCVVLVFIIAGMGCWLVYERSKLIEVKLQKECIGVVTITAYSPTERQTDSTPYITASGIKVFEGGIAVSRDLLDVLDFGDFVYIPLLDKYFIVNDVMNKRYKKRVDVFFFSEKEALKFGKKSGRLFWVKG